MEMEVPFDLEHNLREDRLGTAVADTLRNTYIQNRCKSVQKLILRPIIATLHHKRTLLSLDEEHTRSAVL